MMTPPLTRAAIVGTYPTWVQTPWDDPGLVIAGLNDAYSLNGFQRADEWYELHPLHKFYFRKRDQRAVVADQVPPGHFVRPEGHLEWLKERASTIPVWLQEAPPTGWPPNARQFPKADLEAEYGAYWASGPSYMLAHFMARGVKELHIYGIHLATEHEYREQRPNFEQLMRAFIGRQMKVRTKDKLRYYEGAETLLVLPASCPLLSHPWQYGYQPKPQPHPAKADLRRLQQEQSRLVTALVQRPRWQARAPQADRLRRVEALMQDCQLQIGKAHEIPVIRIGG